MGRAVRKLRRGAYLTDDERHVLERDVGSIDEWDNEDPPEWWVYPAATVLEGGLYGPPDALNPWGFPTRREAADYAARLS